MGPDYCPHCNAELPTSVDRCVTCDKQVDPPNVRSVNQPPERNSLNERVQQVLAKAKDTHRLPAVTRFRNHVERSGRVVIAISYEVAAAFTKSPTSIYSNYELLVAAEGRVPANRADDTMRCVVGGWLFGSFAHHIRYGMLSTTPTGLPTYGDIFFNLKSSAISHRTTFSEWNSYTFASRIANQLTPPPPGHQSSCSTRADLAVAKLGDRIAKDQTEADMDELIAFRGKSRNEDDFIEAHIYGPIHQSAIETIESLNQPHSTAARNDVAILREQHSRLRA